MKTLEQHKAEFEARRKKPAYYVKGMAVPEVLDNATKERRKRFLAKRPDHRVNSRDGKSSLYAFFTEVPAHIRPKYDEHLILDNVRKS